MWGRFDSPYIGIYILSSESRLAVTSAAELRAVFRVPSINQLWGRAGPRTINPGNPREMLIRLIAQDFDLNNNLVMRLFMGY